uniref:Ubiquitin carboxyl-terminal hydrolase n=1 Tax=Anser cygnoides TaxID=8845 RepID=A0A8B9DQR0_ANSCY
LPAPPRTHTPVPQTPRLPPQNPPGAARACPTRVTSGTAAGQGRSDIGRRGPAGARRRRAAPVSPHNSPVFPQSPLRRPSPSPRPDPAALRPPSPPRAAEDAAPEEPGSPGAAAGSESGPAGAGPGSSGAPSPPGEESRSLDSLESFSNLHSGCPSSSELNSDAEEAAAAAEAAPGGPAPEPGGDRPAAGAQLLSSSKERFPGQSVYHIKWVRWKEENTPVITQNENGPCPLLAIMNVLLLAWKVPGLRADVFVQLRGMDCKSGHDQVLL